MNNFQLSTKNKIEGELKERLPILLFRPLQKLICIRGKVSYFVQRTHIDQIAYYSGLLSLGVTIINC